VFTAFLDASVLVPVSLTDTILRAAERDIFRPLWSKRILDETSRALGRVHPGTAQARFDVRIAEMTRAFPDAIVAGYEAMEPSIELPDPDDRHVVAAARVGGADLLVTRNLKDFPAELLGQWGLEVIGPDDFLRDMLDLFPGQMMSALTEQAGALQRPALDLDDVLISLGLAGASGCVADVREQLELVRR
jgi:predicted nucleic acid-binding protein